MTTWKTPLALTGLACAACCAPLFLPLVLGSGGVAAGLVGLTHGLTADAWVIGTGAAGAAGFAVWWLWRRAAQQVCDCAESCTPACKGLKDGA